MGQLQRRHRRLMRRETSLTVSAAPGAGALTCGRGADWVSADGKLMFCSWTRQSSSPVTTVRCAEPLPLIQYCFRTYGVLGGMDRVESAHAHCGW